VSGLIKRSFSLAGHRTSVALEGAFWDVLLATAQSRGTGLSGLVAAVDAERDGMTPLASALRLLALREARISPGAVGIPGPDSPTRKDSHNIIR
jgi:predicted DNA-binding ribbon-helix-helix protein